MANRKFFSVILIMLFLFTIAFGSVGCGGGHSSNFAEKPNDPTPIPTPDPTPSPQTSYTVIFDSNGGSYVKAQTVLSGENAKIPDDPEKEDNSFMGWYLSEGFAFRFDFSTPISQDITLYAKWWDINDNTDSDNDGMPDELEITYGTDPFNTDTDDDGLTDWDEINWLGYNPLIEDTDGNGILDRDEDPDEDGLTNIQEANYGTNMIVKDTDHDNLTDYEEVITYHTNPLLPDTDGDGVDDGTEIAIGSDPLTPETSFTTTLEADYTSLHPEAADISIKMISSANAAGSLVIMPASYQYSPFISRYIPGYITAWVLNADASFDIAEITFTLGTEAGEINDDFQPAIYCLDEDTGILRKVEDQHIEGRKIIAEVSHFSIYVLLNSKEFDEVWSADIRPPSAGNAETGNMNLDIVFVIDCSGSMINNDPERLAVELSKNFVDKLRDNDDRAAVVTFTETSRIVNTLTDDKNTLKSALDAVVYDYWGMTDGTTGIKSALDIIESSSAEYKYILFLTDGADTRRRYSYETLIQSAKDNGVIIYTIGIGLAEEDTLMEIASGTGGAYYKATAGTNSEEVLNLEEVYRQIAEEAIDMTTDSNNDGITDYYTRLLDDGTLTINGVPLFCGVLSMDFADNADWDGDGIKNGDEISIKVDKYGIPYIDMKSNPLLVDSDFDGYSDPVEINDMGTSPIKFTMLPSDFDQLRQDNRYPAEYMNYSIAGTGNFFADLMENVVKVFAGDKQKQSKEAFIDYFYTYSTTTEVLSRDARAAERRTQNQDIIDGIHLASSFLKWCRSAVNLFDTVESGNYTLTEQWVKQQDAIKSETEKVMATMLHVKTVDIRTLNSPWRNIAEGIRQDKIDYVEQKAAVSAIRYEASNLQSSVSSLSSLLDDFKKSENGTQVWDKVFKHSTGVFNFFNTGVQTLSAFNKINLPCKWEWVKKASEWRKGTGGKVLKGTFSVALNALDTTAECLSVASTYGKIEANYAEYQKYLDLLRYIEKNHDFPDYVRDGAGEIAGMFDSKGEPDWDEFTNKVTAAQLREVNAGVFNSITDIAGMFFPVIAQLKFVYNAANGAASLVGTAQLAKGMVEAEIYYSIADGSRSLFNNGIKMVAGYFESIKEANDSGEAGKYAVQLAQARIIGLNSVKNLALGAKAVGWIARHITGRSDDAIRNEYNTAINNVYNIIKKCGMVVSENLPTAE